MKRKLMSHYRPHARVQEHGELDVGMTVDPDTGEIKRKIVKPPSMTKQEFVRECDINNVIKAYSQHGMVTHINAKASQGAYQDLPDAVDFQESLHIIKAAEAAFLSLPAKVRERFGQEPEKFLAFLHDPENLEEARKLGILKALEPEPAPLAVKVVNPDRQEPPPGGSKGATAP